MRIAGHYLLQVLADDGHDVTEPVFALKQVRMVNKPIFGGSIAFAVLGFPWRNLPPQYAEITAALVTRLEAQLTGKLPSDDRLRAAVIDDGLFHLLLHSKRGHDKPELIATFARWHEVSGEDRDAVEQGLVEAARAGKLRSFDQA